jgi:secreted Zn-dependent insulinase-like peptidase
MVEVQVRKPDVDVKQYRFVVLENSLQALLISDPKLDVTKGVFLGTDCNAVRLTARTL